MARSKELGDSQHASATNIESVDKEIKAEAKLLQDEDSNRHESKSAHRTKMNDSTEEKEISVTNEWEQRLQIREARAKQERADREASYMNITRRSLIVNSGPIDGANAQRRRIQESQRGTRMFVREIYMFAREII